MPYLILKLKPALRLSEGFLRDTLSKNAIEDGSVERYIKAYSQFFTDLQAYPDANNTNLVSIQETLTPDLELTLSKIIKSFRSNVSFLFNGAVLNDLLDFQSKSRLHRQVNLLNFLRIRLPDTYEPPEELLAQLQQASGVVTVCVIHDVPFPVEKPSKKKKKAAPVTPCTAVLTLPLPTSIGTGLQPYLNELGMNAAWSRRQDLDFPGRGAGVKLAIVDHSWDSRFGSTYCLDNLPVNYPNWSKARSGYVHGTHTLGVLLPRFQTTYPLLSPAKPVPVGLVPNTDIFLSSVDLGIGPDAVYGDVESAVLNAVSTVNKSAGKGVVLVVLGGPGTAGMAGGAPIETKPSSVANCAVVEVVTLATEQGITVIESAGNGGVELTTILPDSGAIIVGATANTTAGAAGPRYNRNTTSDYGGRVDIAVWGEGIRTVGPLPDNFFGQTSVASTIVAGIVTSLLSIAWLEYGKLIPPALIRTWLRNVNNFVAPHPNQLDAYTMPSMNALIAQLELFCNPPP